ncbi:MAG: hypothetical protein IPK82_42320 [Polyangiaceae bacterium]|nr:hypothetical protein [Polyangiaceae bacterium]
MTGTGEPSHLTTTEERFSAAFSDTRRVIDLSQGFVLFPIQVPGPDLARALSDWLHKNGCHVHVIDPQSADEWAALALVLHSLKVANNGAVVVIGTRDLTAALDRGLHLVNQSRDTIAKQLGRPLLWCGPRSFLERTMDEAPDFWSIRSVERIFRPNNPEEVGWAPAPEKEELATENAESEFSLDNSPGDAPFQDRVNLIQEALSTHPVEGVVLARAALDEALRGERLGEVVTLLRLPQLAELSQQPTVLTRDLALTVAKANLKMGQPQEALTVAGALLVDPSVSPLQATSARLVRGEALASLGQRSAALDEFQKAEEQAAQQGDVSTQAWAQIGLGKVTLHLTPLDDTAIEMLERANVLAAQVDDATLKREAKSALADAYSKLFDERRAKLLRM